MIYYQKEDQPLNIFSTEYFGYDELFSEVGVPGKLTQFLEIIRKQLFKCRKWNPSSKILFDFVQTAALE